MTSQNFNSGILAPDDPEDFSGNDDFSESDNSSEKYVLSDDSSSDMSEDEEDSFAQMALEEEREERGELYTPTIYSRTVAPPAPVIPSSRPVVQPRPALAIPQPVLQSGPALVLSSPHPVLQPEPALVLSSSQPVLQPGPYPVLPTPQAFIQARPASALPTPQGFAQPRPTLVLQPSPAGLQPKQKFLQVLSSTGTPLQQIIAPPAPTETKTVKEFLKKDEHEEEQRWKYREKYTLRAGNILRNLSKYMTRNQLKSTFGMSDNQINKISSMNVGQIVSIGYSKTNKLYEKVSYPSDIEMTIKMIDTIKIS